jgi:uncharacterized membrane protein
MGIEKIMQYECRVCGRKIDVTRTGDVYEEPVYCCGLEAVEASVVPTAPAAVKRPAKKKAKKKAKKAIRKPAKKKAKKTVKKKAMKKATKKKATKKKAAKKKARKRR